MAHPELGSGQVCPSSQGAYSGCLGGWAERQAHTHLGLACHRRVVVQLQQPVQPISVERHCVPAAQFDFGLAFDDGNPSPTIKPMEEEKERKVL